ncbi:twin-arginine translocase TatA/TatE family subunit [Capnocytophaga sp. ARDL2]
MLGIDFSEILLILVTVLLIFGPKKSLNLLVV